VTTGWQTLPMSAVTAEFYDGPHATPPPTDEGPIFLGIKNMTEDGHLDLSEIRHISESDYGTWTRRVEPRPGDIVFTYEASLHRYAVLPDGFRGCLGRRVALVRPDPRVADTKYLLYAFIGPEWRRTVQARLNIGATVDRLPLVDFPNFPIRLPPLDIQRKMASILSAYDGLIENNRRRIDLLEEMAQRIFREWFVDFRYPGHVDPPLVESQLGPIPKDWSVAHVREIASCVRGRSYRGTDLVDAGGLPFINLKCVDRDGGFRPEGVKRYAGAYAPAQTVTPGDIVVAVTDMTQERRIVARAARVPPLDQEHGVISMDLVKLVPEDAVPSDYLCGLLRFSSFPDTVKQHANGANVLHLHPDRIGDYRFARPPRGLMERYGQIAHALNAEGDILTQAQEQLSRSRALLLPRLVSGDIDVDDLDISVDEVAS
jgi:type I restriction enzyme, S subunit